MDTNFPEKLLSVNDSILADWSGLLNGMTVFTNLTPFPQFQPITNGFLTIPPAGPDGVNSVVGQLVAAINNARMQFKNMDGIVGTFETIGDILSTPQLTQQSPFLNWNNITQQQYGISDKVYEIIPDQLLPLLRQDSVGTIRQVNEEWSIQFSGSDSFTYILQASTDLIHWSSLSTNCPVQGHFNVPLSSLTNSHQQFYRSLLIP